MKKHIPVILLGLSITFGAQPLCAEPEIDPIYLKDPSTRNEDISKTLVTVSYSVRPDGYYNYEYTLSSSAENLGRILIFSIDISCDQPNTSSLGLTQIKNYSPDGKHIVAETDDPNYYMHSLGPVITAINYLHWLTPLNPGDKRTGIKVVTKEAPVVRAYELYPTSDDENWDYETYPDAPRIGDFIVTGTTIGPRCSTDTSPIPDDPNNPPDDTGCLNGKGKALGLETGKGHEISQGKHLGHEHDCK